MKWTCRKCVLQRDDRRGSTCEGIKGQAHDWIETEEFLDLFSVKLWQLWLKTNDGIDFVKEKKCIEEEYEHSIAPFRDSDVKVQQKRHSNISAFFSKKRKMFFIGLVVISIVCAFSFKSFRYLFISIIAVLIWIVFFVLTKIHFNKAANLSDEYAKLIKPYIDKRTVDLNKLYEKNNNIVKEFITENETVKKLEEGNLETILRNFKNIINENVSINLIVSKYGYIISSD